MTQTPAPLLLDVQPRTLVGHPDDDVWALLPHQCYGRHDSGLARHRFNGTPGQGDFYRPRHVAHS